jgi:glucosamine-6-phosphate deaminase
VSAVQLACAADIAAKENDEEGPNIMKIYRKADYEAMSRQAANILSAQIILTPDTVLGLATGSTPVGMYRQLIDWYKKGDVDFSQVRTVNLDEYVGLAPTHDQSYRRFMQVNLFDHINIDSANTNVPNGLATDLTAECQRYDQLIADLGGVDFQVLGMGHNGHIGFNEPAEDFVTGTHVVDLTDDTIDANARFFASRDDVPRQALTMGIKAIMRAKHILLLVSGAEKADALKAALTGPVTPKVPASILQLHQHVSLVADEAALSKL